MALGESAFCNVLSQLRVSGALVLSHVYPPPWAIEVPSAAKLAEFFKVDTQTSVVPFHIVTDGWFEYVPEQGERVRVNKGQLIICANGKGHMLNHGKPESPFTFEEVADIPEQIGLTKADPLDTAILCGAFLLRNSKNNPLINALPDVIRVDTEGENSSFSMRQLFQLFNNEMGSEKPGRRYMIERLLEVLYAESIRDYVLNHPAKLGNWLHAQKDHRIAKALDYIHQHIERTLNIECLAEAVHMSKSRFAALFKKSVGESPMSYILNWRMELAANKILAAQLNLSDIAEQAGYASQAAFSHAFTRIYGKAPMLWKKATQTATLI